jgi:beta-glucosidase
MSSTRRIRVPGAVLATAALVAATGACSGTRWTETERGTLRIVTNEGGPTLGYSTTSGVTLLAH